MTQFLIRLFIRQPDHAQDPKVRAAYGNLACWVGVACNLLPYCGEAVCLSVEGPLKILGPSVVPLRGGMAGTYLATTGEAGRAVLHCRMEGALDTEAVLTVRSREEQNV